MNIILQGYLSPQIVTQGYGGEPVPVADFIGTPFTGNAPLTVTFTDLSTNSPTSWLWDFGDGSTSTLQNPSHIYAANGTYTVSLTATNASGSNVKVKIGYIVVGVAVQRPSSSGGGTRWGWIARQKTAKRILKRLKQQSRRTRKLPVTQDRAEQDAELAQQIAEIEARLADLMTTMTKAEKRRRALRRREEEFLLLDIF